MLDSALVAAIVGMAVGYLCGEIQYRMTLRRIRRRCKAEVREISDRRRGL